jgi:acyl carrier protein phosphodiesterase
MNFLAHLYLADRRPDALLGSLMGDFVKGPLQGRFPPELTRALSQHRKVDAFTDAHPMVRVSRARMPPARRRFAGIMVDVFYDHFLALHWEDYADQPLEAFAHEVYALLRTRRCCPSACGGSRRSWRSSTGSPPIAGSKRCTWPWTAWASGSSAATRCWAPARS